MTNRKFIAVLILSLIATFLFRCKPMEIILHGDIRGVVTDASSGVSIPSASVILSPVNDTTNTGDDGSYLFKNLTPQEYEIQVLKNGYADSKQNAVVASAETKQIDFSLNEIPSPNPSVTFLDFGLDSTSLRFSISNIGKGTFTYILAPSKDWITVSPFTGDITSEPENIIVTINKTGLTENIYNETIKIISFVGQVELREITIPVYLNGVSDHDGNYYKVVRIGPQIWMAEDLNVGTQIKITQDATKNEIIEKYCYNNNPENCKIYGGLYQWDEMMQYSPSNNEIIVTTQGICPDGWHIPGGQEWHDLVIYLDEGHGEKLKEAGYTHWLMPNLGGTNESGFTALPGGYSNPETHVYGDLFVQGYWWSSDESISDPATDAFSLYLNNNLDISSWGQFHKKLGFSVRCVKNPGKK